MTVQSAEAINDVLPVMVDSCLGYKQAHDLVDDNPSLRTQLLSRYETRNQIVDAMKAYVSRHGREPATDGGMLGSMHRGWTEIVAKFQDDREAAMDAVETGEEHLFNQLKEKLDDDALDDEGRALVQRAMQEAKAGEAFADAND
jgi:uncharacterized protein (TIGR02284 family)